MRPNFKYMFWDTYNSATDKWTVSYATILIVPIFIVGYPNLLPIWETYSEGLRLVCQFGNYGIFPKGTSLGYFQPYHEIECRTTHISNLSEIEMRVTKYRLYHQYNYRHCDAERWPSPLNLNHILSEAGYREYLLSIMLEDLNKTR